MKRASHLADRVTLYDIRREAERIAVEHKYRRYAARRFLNDFDRLGPDMLRKIHTGTWVPHPVRAEDVVEHGKLRHIEVPCFYDMLLQRAFFYPRVERVLVNHTWPHAFSSIKGRGPLKAAKHVARLIRSRKARWCLYFDVRKFYEHISRDILKADMREMIKDPVALRLIDSAIDMGEKGLAIGNTASHFLANIYLTPVAKTLAGMEKVSDVVTYMDNVFIFASSKKALHAVRLRACGLLTARGLSMKNDWQVFRTDMREVRVGGFRVQLGRPWRIYRATFQHLRRVLRNFKRRPTLHRARSLASLKGWIAVAGCQHFYTKHIKNEWRYARKVIQNAN